MRRRILGLLEGRWRPVREIQRCEQLRCWLVRLHCRVQYFSVPASAAEVCDRNCVGPLCGESCPDVTVGKTVREPDVTVEERRRVREPDVEIRRERRPGVDVETKR
jgi:hypothetical protein